MAGKISPSNTRVQIYYAWSNTRVQNSVLVTALLNTQGSYFKICVEKHNICVGNSEIILIGNSEIKRPRICQTANFNGREFKCGYRMPNLPNKSSPIISCFIQ